MPQAATIAASAALLLAAWGAFIAQNRRTEELEPESMAAAKLEDTEVRRKEGAEPD